MRQRFKYSLFNMTFNEATNVYVHMSRIFRLKIPMLISFQSLYFQNFSCQTRGWAYLLVPLIHRKYIFWALDMKRKLVHCFITI